jgi:hypothetical protein
MPNAHSYTAAPMASTPPLPAPAFIRLPRPGNRDPHTGLTRTSIYNLINTGQVQSRIVKQPGCKRGIRLIDFPSLISFIQGQAKR